MDNYLKLYREIISLCGLTDHTMKSYSTYIRAYLNYLDRILKKTPEDVSWDDSLLPMRRFDTYLPYVPTQEQVRHFISTMSDFKQKTMVSIMCSAGLLIGEVCRLRNEDIDRKNMRIGLSALDWTGKIIWH